MQMRSGRQRQIGPGWEEVCGRQTKERVRGGKTEEHRHLEGQDSCAINRDDVKHRVHYTDNPARYLDVLANHGMFYKFIKEYNGKGKVKRRTSAMYKYVCSRRKGFDECPA